MDRDQQYEYLTLGYTVDGENRSMAVIAIDTEDPKKTYGSLTVYPEWRRWVPKVHQDYFEFVLACIQKGCITDPLQMLSEVRWASLAPVHAFIWGKCSDEGLAGIKAHVMAGGKLPTNSGELMLAENASSLRGKNKFSLQDKIVKLLRRRG